MSRLSDILKKNEGRLPDDILMAYAQGKLSPEEQHEIELFLAEEGPESDAAEGLKDYGESELNDVVKKLNLGLTRQLNKPKKRRTESIKKTPWGITGMLLILLLCLAAYIVIYLLTKK